MSSAVRSLGKPLGEVSAVGASVAQRIGAETGVKERFRSPPVLWDFCGIMAVSQCFGL